MPFRLFCASLCLLITAQEWSRQHGGAWSEAISRRDGPSALLFTRQAVPYVTRSDRQVEAIRRGGYVLRDAANGKPDVVIIFAHNYATTIMKANDDYHKAGGRFIVPLPAPKIV